MINREELLKSPEYWFENAQNDLYGEVVAFMEKEGINQNMLAKRLGVSKGYVSQVLKGEFNYTLKKLIELSLAIGKVPSIEYKNIADVLSDDKRTHYLQEEIELSRSEFSNTGFNGESFLQLNSRDPKRSIGQVEVTKSDTMFSGQLQFLKSV